MQKYLPPQRPAIQPKLLQGPLRKEQYIAAAYTVIKEWRRLAAGLAAVYGLMLILFLNQYFTDWAERMESCFFADFIEAVEYAGDLEADYYYTLYLA